MMCFLRRGDGKVNAAFDYGEVAEPIPEMRDGCPYVTKHVIVKVAKVKERPLYRLM